MITHPSLRLKLPLAAALVLAAVAWGTAANAQAASTCTWAGTPTAQSGSFTVNPGVTNTPSAGPLKFVASGPLGGDDKRCRGQMKWVGQLDAGSSCAFASFEGAVKGLRGVARFWGKGNLLVPSYLYDKAGNLVGIENAQIVSEANFPGYFDCNKPTGFTGATFSSTVVLFH